MTHMDFFTALDQLLAGSEFVVDRPRSSTHPRYPDVVYPIDYGYLSGTRAGDGGGVDVFKGSAPHRGVTAVYFTIDRSKRDLEAKLLIDCTHEEIETVGRFLGSMNLSPHLVQRPE